MITQEPVIQRGIAVSCLLVMKVIQTRKPLLELFYLTPKVKKKKSAGCAFISSELFVDQE